MSGMFSPEAGKKALVAKTEDELDAILESERPDELGAKTAAKEADAKRAKGEQPEYSDVPEIVEGVNWKQRYANLQKYIDKNLKVKHKEETDALTAKLDKLSADVAGMTARAAPAELPTSKAEVESLRTENPAAYAAIVAIAGDIADRLYNDKVKSLEGTVNEINKRQSQSAEEAAFIALQRRHKDVDLTALNESVEFHEWLNTKSTRMQKALRENKGDVDAASEVIDLYKYENGLVGKKKASQRDNSDSDAARQPKLKGGKVELSDEVLDGFDFAESEISAMSASEFDKKSALIEKAMQEGRIFPDVSDPNKARMLAQANRRA
jgi:hypothetical protein